MTPHKYESNERKMLRKAKPCKKRHKKGFVNQKLCSPLTKVCYCFTRLTIKF